MGSPRIDVVVHISVRLMGEVHAVAREDHTTLNGGVTETLNGEVHSARWDDVLHQTICTYSHGGDVGDR